MALTFTQLGADTFNRANENPLNPTNWLAMVSGQYAGFPMQIVSNQCTETNALGSMNLWVGSAIPADQYCEFKITQLNTFDDYVTLLLRNSHDTNFGAAYEFNIFGPFGASAGYDIAQISSDGTNVDYDWYPANVTITINAGDVFRFAVVGQGSGRWYLYQNGTLIDSKPLSDSGAAGVVASGRTGVQAQGGIGTNGFTNFATGSVTQSSHSPFFGMGRGR